MTTLEFKKQIERVIQSGRQALRAELDRHGQAYMGSEKALRKQVLQSKPAPATLN